MSALADKEMRLVAEQDKRLRFNDPSKGWGVQLFEGLDDGTNRFVSAGGAVGSDVKDGCGHDDKVKGAVEKGECLNSRASFCGGTAVSESSSSHLGLGLFEGRCISWPSYTTKNDEVM